jgi:hypothetical protein
MHKVLHQTAIVVDEEVLTKLLQGLLYAFVANRVCELDHRRHQPRRCGHKHLGAPKNETVDDAPWVTPVSDHRVTKSPELRVILQLAPEDVVELERWATESA